MQKPSSLGMGLGLRPVYYPDILDKKPNVDWFEIISENFMIPGGRPLAMLDRIRADYPIVMHGVSMSIGSTAPLNMDYLAGLKALAERVEPAWISDHLCWTGVHGVNLHDLMPLPYTEESLRHVASRIGRVQDFLGRRIAIENVSSYVTFATFGNGRMDLRAGIGRTRRLLVARSTSTTSSSRASITISRHAISSIRSSPNASCRCILPAIPNA